MNARTFKLKTPNEIWELWRKVKDDARKNNSAVDQMMVIVIKWLLLAAERKESFKIHTSDSNSTLKNMAINKLVADLYADNVYKEFLEEMVWTLGACIMKLEIKYKTDKSSLSIVPVSEDDIVKKSKILSR